MPHDGGLKTSGAVVMPKQRQIDMGLDGRETLPTPRRPRPCFLESHFFVQPHTIWCGRVEAGSIAMPPHRRALVI